MQLSRSGPRGVSPVVGVILMVAITVILAATLAIFVLDLGNLTSSPAQAGVQVDEQGHYVDVKVLSMSDADRVVVDVGAAQYRLDSVGDRARVPAYTEDITVSATKNGEKTVLQTADGAPFTNDLLTNPTFAADGECVSDPTGWTYEHATGYDAYRIVSIDGATNDVAFGNQWHGEDCSTGDQPGTYGDGSATVHQEVTAIDGGETLVGSARVNLLTFSEDGLEECEDDKKFILEDDARFRLVAYDSAGDPIAEQYSPWGGETHAIDSGRYRFWGMIGFVFETPSETDSVRIELQGGDGNSSCVEDGTGGNAGVYFDDVRITTSR